jgi:hypothetical protein
MYRCGVREAFMLLGLHQIERDSVSSLSIAIISR